MGPTASGKSKLARLAAARMARLSMLIRAAICRFISLTARPTAADLTFSAPCTVFWMRHIGLRWRLGQSCRCRRGFIESAQAADHYWWDRHVSAGGGQASRRCLICPPPFIVHRTLWKLVVPPFGGKTVEPSHCWAPSHGDRQRLIRAMGVAKASDTPLSQWQAAPHQGPCRCGGDHRLKS